MLLHAPGLPTHSGFAPAAPEPPALTVAHGRCTGRGLAAHPIPSQSYQGSSRSGRNALHVPMCGLRAEILCTSVCQGEEGYHVSGQ